MKIDEEYLNLFVYPDRLTDDLILTIALELLERWGGKSAVALAKQKLGDRGPIGVLDFWDTFYAFAGIVLKPAPHVTAGNYRWELGEVALEELILYSSIPLFDELIVEDRCQVHQLQEALAKPGVIQRMERYIKAGNYPVDTRPLMVRTINSHEGLHYGVDEGNEAVLHALVKGQLALPAYICHTNGKQPQDFWVPVVDMIGLVRQARHYPFGALAARVQLSFLLKHSEIARFAYRQRVVGWERGAKLLGWGLY